MTQAIFLSYASQDADAARRICEALRAAGLEVWFDQSELRGGDAWDASIRKQIKECALFVPIISANTQSREEGYFRREWNLAVNRMLDMDEHRTFLLPVLLAGVTERDALVPDKFRERQWTRLQDETAIVAFATRVGSQLTGTGRPDPAPVLAAADPAPSGAANSRVVGARPVRLIAIAGAVVLILSLAVYVNDRDRNAARPTGPSADAAAPSVTSTINPLSVMVMPFANQTGDKEKAYIADALTSSITSDLSRIRDAFIVPAATAFSLQGKTLTIPQLGKEAAVRFVLTGNVTGDKEKLRINAVLSDTQTGAQLWTENFDGKQADLFALQDQVTTRIGNTIGSQMVIVAARESEKRASTPQVADLLMRASALALNQGSLKNHQAMEALYRQALTLEPGNLSAKAGLAYRLVLIAGDLKLDRAGRIALAKQAVDLAEEVRRVDPNNPLIYATLAGHALISGDIEGAVRAGKRRVELEPKNSFAHSNLGRMFLSMGDMPGARAALEKALQFASAARRPAETYYFLAQVSFIEDRPDEVIKWAQQAMDANPNYGPNGNLAIALAYARKGDQARARKAAAEALRLNPNLRLDLRPEIMNSNAWPGKEAAYRKFIETQFAPAWRLAGLPE